MYKILNKIFGWDYIYWENTADRGIARVYVDAKGNAYYFRYKIIKFIDHIRKPTDVIWLTCLPIKYFKDTPWSL